MGVKFLNSYLTSHCKYGIHPIQLNSFSNKKVVVDVSIYLYKYKSVDKLLPNMGSFIKTLSTLCITPIFVFDGKPKEHKKKTLDARQEQKNSAWKQYNDTITTSSPSTLQYLKSQFTRITQRDISEVKQLMDSLGAIYIVAPYEADEVCAKLMLTQQVHACVSDDMDMLVHGCSHVIRHVNLDTQTATVYNLKNILRSLHMSYCDFKQLCIISGTDYYSSDKNLFDYVKLYRQFKKTGCNDFYDWLISNDKISNPNELVSSFEMFNIDNFEYLNSFTLKESPLLQAQQASTSESAGSCSAEG
jgi:5'-3' exonuclease